MEAFIEAAIEFGGNSLEIREKITEVLSGVCRSFVQAEEGIAELEMKHAARDPDPS